jgi:predicted DCC family thiol-disulfide oxidoreductase YuxK
MKTTDKILLYDDYCPLCTWYSGLFVRSGLLKPGNRVAFSKADISVLTAIDIEKGKDEIPLFDPATRQTLYGIDSLLEILGQQCGSIKKAGNIKPVKWLLKRLYKFVSYNRKVIVARKCGPGTFDCSPGFNIPYRIIFILAFLLFNTFMLFPLHDHVFSHLSFYHLTITQLQCGHLALVGTNLLLAAFLSRRTAIEYLGQVAVLSLINILLLIIVLLFNLVLPVSEWVILFFLVSITTLLIKEYRRRMKYAGIINRHKSIVWINILCLIIFLGYVFH